MTVEMIIVLRALEWTLRSHLINYNLTFADTQVLIQCGKQKELSAITNQDAGASQVRSNTHLVKCT